MLFLPLREYRLDDSTVQVNRTTVQLQYYYFVDEIGSRDQAVGNHARVSSSISGNGDVGRFLIFKLI